MSLAYPSSPSGRFIRLVDTALVVWTAVWVAIGIVVAVQVRGLTELSNTVIAGGRVLQATGQQLGVLGDVPFVGDRIRDVSDEVNRAADSAIASGRDSRERTRRLSVLLGFAVGLVPSVPLIALYVPLRVARAREVRGIRGALAERPDDPVLERFLARRAAQNLTFRELRGISDDPWRDLERGDHRPLADAELRRLGIARPAPEGPPRAVAPRGVRP